MKAAVELLLAAMVLPVLLTGCDDSDEERAARAAQFTTSTKPAPNPQLESLETLVRTDSTAPTRLGTAPKFELYSQYKGEDIRQVTGVSGRSLVLCFTAPWCPHSAKMKQSLQQLAKAEKGMVQVVDVNADAYPALATDFGITKVPTTIFYTEGVKLRTIEGAYTADSLGKFLHALLTQGDKS
ncbi:MAG: thioredoxin family protein [Akkermansia sp.]|nr:thioredoxin family protein [Akkermansia sp.]